MGGQPFSLVTKEKGLNKNWPPQFSKCDYTIFVAQIRPQITSYTDFNFLSQLIDSLRKKNCTLIMENQTFYKVMHSAVSILLGLLKFFCLVYLRRKILPGGINSSQKMERSFKLLIHLVSFSAYLASAKGFSLVNNLTYHIPYLHN